MFRTISNIKTLKYTNVVLGELQIPFARGVVASHATPLFEATDASVVPNLALQMRSTSGNGISEIHTTEHH